MWMDLLNGCFPPKRGDLIHSNVGNRRERTWFVLRARKIKRKVTAVPRYELWMARWWELEVPMRMRLFESAERNGGQSVIYMKRYPAKKKKRFEDFL